MLLINQTRHFDTGFLLVVHDANLGSPVSVLFYDYYNSLEDIKKYIEMNNDAIQCVISAEKSIPGSIGFGESQKPNISDYADGVDTIEFLKIIGDN
jgi:hypothetical protein